MPQKAAIPEALWSEVLRRHRAGLNPQQIADWLRTQEVVCSHMAVRRLLEKLASHPPPARPIEVPEDSTPSEVPTGNPTSEETLRHWMRKAHVEATAAEEDDWKRYHSAIRLVVTLDQAIDKKRLYELEMGNGSRQPLTTDEETAALEAARLGAIDLYGLVDPATLPAPGPGNSLETGSKLVN